MKEKLNKKYLQKIYRTNMYDPIDCEIFNTMIVDILKEVDLKEIADAIDEKLNYFE